MRKTMQLIWVYQTFTYSAQEEYEADRLKVIISSKGRVPANIFVIGCSYVPPRKSTVCYRSHVEVILRVRQYFENEKLCKRRSDSDNVIRRTVEAMGLRKKVVSKTISEKVVTNWKFQDADSVRRNRSVNVPEKCESVLRQVIRDLFLEEKKVPTLDNILTKLKRLNSSEAVQHNLFDD